MADAENSISMSLDEFAKHTVKRNRHDTSQRSSTASPHHRNITDQHKRFRPTNFNPNNYLQNRRPVGMGVPGGQRHRSGSRGGKRQIRWNGREMSVQLHKTIVVKVLPNGVVILNSGGWRTMQTLTTINSVIKFIQLRVHYIGNDVCYGHWFVTNDHGWSARFEDNMCITGGGLDVSGRVDVLLRNCPPVPINHRHHDIPRVTPSREPANVAPPVAEKQSRTDQAPQPRSNAQFTQKDLAALCERCSWQPPKYVSTIREVNGKTQVMCSEVRLSLTDAFKLSVTTGEPARWCSEVSGARDVAASRTYTLLMEKIMGPVNKAMGADKQSSLVLKTDMQDKIAVAIHRNEADDSTLGVNDDTVDTNDDDDEEDDDKEDNWRR